MRREEDRIRGIASTRGEVAREVEPLARASRDALRPAAALPTLAARRAAATTVPDSIASRIHGRMFLH